MKPPAFALRYCIRATKARLRVSVRNVGGTVECWGPCRWHGQRHRHGSGKLTKCGQLRSDLIHIAAPVRLAALWAHRRSLQTHRRNSAYPRVTQLLAEVPGGIARNVNVGDDPFAIFLCEVVDSDPIPAIHLEFCDHACTDCLDLHV